MKKVKNNHIGKNFVEVIVAPVAASVVIFFLASAIFKTTYILFEQQTAHIIVNIILISTIGLFAASGPILLLWEKRHKSQGKTTNSDTI